MKKLILLLLLVVMTSFTTDTTVQNSYITFENRGYSTKSIRLYKNIADELYVVDTFLLPKGSINQINIGQDWVTYYHYSIDGNSILQITSYRIILY